MDTLARIASIEAAENDKASRCFAQVPAISFANEGGSIRGLGEKFKGNLIFICILFLTGCYEPQSRPDEFNTSLINKGADDQSCAPGNWDLDTQHFLNNIPLMLPESSRNAVNYEAVNGSSTASFSKDGEYIVCMNLEIFSSSEIGIPNQTTLIMEGQQKGIFSVINNKLKSAMTHDDVEKKGSVQLGDTKIPLPKNSNNPFFIVPSSGDIFCPSEKELIISSKMSDIIDEPVTLRFLHTKSVDCSECSTKHCDPHVVKQPSVPPRSSVLCPNSGGPLLSPNDWQNLQDSSQLSRQQQIDFVIEKLKERGLLDDWAPQAAYREGEDVPEKYRAAVENPNNVFRAVTTNRRETGTIIYFFPYTFESPRHVVNTILHESRHVLQAVRGHEYGSDTPIAEAAIEVDAYLYQIENAHLTQLTTREMTEILREVRRFWNVLPGSTRQRFRERRDAATTFTRDMLRAGDQDSICQNR